MQEINDYSNISSNKPIFQSYSFSVSKSPYPSGILVNRLKGFVQKILEGKNIDDNEKSIIAIVNDDIINHPEEDKDHLSWILLYCTELGDNPSTLDFYNQVEEALATKTSM